MNFNLNIKMAKQSLKTHKTSFRPKLSSLHIVYTPVIPFDNFTDVLGLFENYLISTIFINIDRKNYEKFGKSRKNNIYTYIVTSVWHVNRPRMIKVVAA